MRPLDRTATAARFLLGGIGTGTISLDQNARLCDFEIWNVPNKGFRSPYSFFVVRTETPDGVVKTKALESQLAPPFDRSHGYNAWEIGGLPRFRSSQMSGDYPFVNYTFEDPNMPVSASLEAFTPFIPLNTDDSSLPGAVLRYKVRNNTGEPLTVSVAGTLSNLPAYAHRDIWAKPLFENAVNSYIERDFCKGILFTRSDRTESDLDYMELSLLTTEKSGVSYLDQWNSGAWWDELQDFWNDLTEDGELSPGHKIKSTIGNTVHKAGIPLASVCVKKVLAPGEETSFEYVISWYHPNRVRSWYQQTPVSEEHPIIRNYYAKFGPALTVAEYLITNLPRLEGDSRRFVSALRASTVPEYVLDAISATITVIRSNTCFRVEDGTFFGWEGNFDTAGCCDGNCTHVWNYTQSLAFLFPELERSMRETEFLWETMEDGRMYFRAYRYLNDGEHDMLPAADGQLGTIVRLYRDWMLCGDDAFLKKLWPKAKLALEYGIRNWDADGDGVLGGAQHNTYDIEFYGLTSMLNSIFYAALRAAEQISRYLGDDQDADRYADICEKGARILDAETFNGEYYEQVVEDVEKYKYQYGAGCLADHLLGQQLAHVSRLGYVLNPENVKKSVHSIYKYNYRNDFSDFANLQRTYALNQNAGLLLCSWPKGGRPEIPFVYCDEVWTGIEYQVASHLIYEGFVAEGLKIVESSRARHDGIERNPWNEVECGHHYARSLASYAVLLALSGFHCDAVKKTLTFSPAITPSEFTSFFCCADGWGLYHQTRDEDGQLNRRIETLYGDLSGYRLA